MIRRSREKVFGPGRAVPLDRNAKARIAAYARAWGARHRQPGQPRARSPAPSWRCWRPCCGGFPQFPLRLLLPELRGDRRQGRVRPQPVAEALKALEWAGVLTWQNRIARIHVRERDLFGHWASHWRVIRTSNAYVFRDPQQRPEGVPASKSENPPGTQNQKILSPGLAPPIDPDSPLERALQQLSSAIKGRLLPNKRGGMVPAT